MEIARYCLRFLALMVTGLLFSCIDGREEVWLAADGSGRADVCYSMPLAAARLQGGEEGIRRMIGEFLGRSPAIESSAFEVMADQDRLKVRVRLTFKSALELAKITTGSSANKLPAAASHLVGEVKVDFHGLNVEFSRTLSPGSAMPGAFFMPASQFEGRNLTYIIHLPDAATESNATRTEDAGRTLVWDFPLAEAIQRPFTTRFKAPVSLPRWLLFTAPAGLSLGLLAFLGWRRARRAQRP